MLGKILGTIGTRYLIALLNLALIFVNAKVLGVEGVGRVGLIVASINIAVIFNGILSGGTIVYFMNRYSMRTIFLPAYLWTFVGSALACACMYLAGLLPAAYGPDIYLLAIVNSIVAANARFLLGKDHIKGFNLTFILQGGSLFFILLYLYYGANLREVRSYVWGLYATNSIALAASLILLLPYLLRETPRPAGKPLYKIVKEMFAYGLWAGADGLAETCTTRLNYFLMERFSGLGGVGLLDAGTKVSESVWHISRSVSFITYSNVARTADVSEQKRITLRLLKLTFCAMTLVMGCILCIPEWVYTDYLFSAEFGGVRKVITGLSAGIVTLGCNSVVGHYFIGSGKIRYSAASSCIGLVTLWIAGSVLIPAYGIVGAAVSTSIAFTAMLLFSLSVFMRQTSTTFLELIPGREDWEYLRRTYKERGKAS
ncbi:lipopolysaccharide biosynthesis protein [Parabacteroides sp. ZJ-118]|uniref:lipopolysaccharide biosynthesis protein n=1 Tax=Parabacteroides sp. ZJ-118 TaxID=2709398 RepID=UPI0013EE1BBF|nr:polysaccharide biosynthesis C-terminal domain-containing protein [Parabacteroides sp. ZJ-118]